MFPFPNELIAQLPSADQVLLIENARLVELKTGDVLVSPDADQPLIYFMTSGSVALFVSHTSGIPQSGLAVGLIGREGALGLQAALGLGVGNISLIVQSNGFAYVLKAQRLRQLMKRHPNWLKVFYRNLWFLFLDISRLAALSQVHDIKQRLADWLLMSDVRCGHENLFMTHEHMAQMLGVRRASITLAAKQLKDMGFIDYSRGHIKLLNRPALVALASP